MALFVLDFPLVGRNRSIRRNHPFPAISAMQIHIHHDGQQQGPLDLELVRSRLADGSLLGSDLAWHEGMADWMPLSAVLAQAGGAVPPPPMPGGALPIGQAAVYAGQRPQTSGLAIASMILGILSLVMGGLTSLPAVICGHLSLSRMKKSAGAITGQGVAITGLVTGYIGLAVFALFFLGLIAGIALPVFNQVQIKAQQVKALAEAKQVGLACKLYAGDHDGKYPESLDDLVPKYFTDKRLLVCHLAKDGPNEGYDYAGGKDTDPATDVLLSSHATSRDHKKVVVYKDGSGAVVRE